LGIYQVPSDVETLVKNADAAMYHAKEMGRNAFRFFSAELASRRTHRMQVESALRRALRDNELRLHYQPIVDLSRQRMVGVEALLRWSHPQLGLVPPAEFIALAEGSGAIVEIGQWVLHTACRQMKAWADAGHDDLYVAVNVYSVDVRFIETFLKYAPRSAPPRWLFVVTAIATAVVPLGVLAWGLKSRRMVLVDTGLVLLALSLVTLRQYVHVAPLWVVLTAAGALLIVAGLAVERALRRSPDGERAGFTADALFSDDRRQRLLQTVPVVAAFTPAVHHAPAEEPGFAGRGGEFGGGGASDRF